MRHVALAPPRLGQHVGALGAQVLARRPCAAPGTACRVSARIDGVPLAVQRQLPALGRLDGVGRAEHVEVGHGPQRRQMLDRLMRGAVLAEPDRVVRHHVDDALAHQRRQADRRAGSSR